ncbi:23S rRNA (adenine(1618)-N(6))-methyltransferase RlmF [Maribacter sp. CXY002]|uniref:23S rRNA (adenine(1618)-N(6))-methyltransferase RlmF n=1 Tax=Maribacter luteocoastalis TaxID=3407671 RepID=UPI003B676276
MHPQNPFLKDYNFDILTKSYPPLGDFVLVNDFGTTTIKFADPKAVKALNTALLKAHYGVDWAIPEGYLCPPIPGRLDYLLHIKDLVGRDKLNLLDIGCGANLIYPILATCHFNWRCVGSEVHLESLMNAQEIICSNVSLSTVKLRHQRIKQNILKDVVWDDDKFDVVVCNPPFYKSRLDAQDKNKRKVKNLALKESESLNFGGRSNELWYKGGELAFIRKMVEESLLCKNQVDWFTTLVSQKESVKGVKRAINKAQPSMVKEVSMDLGNKQTRFLA